MKILAVFMFALSLLAAVPGQSGPPLDGKAFLKTIRPTRKLPRPPARPSLAPPCQSSFFLSWAQNKFHEISHRLNIGHHCCLSKADGIKGAQIQLQFFTKRLDVHREFLSKLGLALGSDGHGACSDEEIRELIATSGGPSCERGFFTDKFETRKVHRRACEDPYITIVRHTRSYAAQRLQQSVELWPHYENDDRQKMIDKEMAILSAELGEIGDDMLRYFIYNARRLPLSEEELSRLDREIETVSMTCLGVKDVIYLHLLQSKYP